VHAKKGPRKPEEDTVYGVTAARAVMNVRPRDVLRLSHTDEVAREIGGLLKIAAEHGVPVTLTPAKQLETMARSVHHEGICLLVRPRKLATVASLAGARTVLVLDGVANPHNVGAILRTAAYFGVQGMVLPRPAQGPLLPPSAVRIAEGGAEHVPLCFVDDLATALKSLRVPVIGAAPRAKHDARSFAWPPACAVVLGGERSGLSEKVRAACTEVVAIAPGITHPVESLNVSVAAGILLAARGVS
jgi:TrmH RNA methyltransferase